MEKRPLEILKEKSRITENIFSCSQWGVNTLDARDYFEGYDSFLGKVQGLFRELKEKGEKIAVVDLCGEASAVSLGADMTHCFRLGSAITRVQTERDNTSQDIIMEGDFFDEDDLLFFYEQVRKRGVLPALITFRPGAAFVEQNKEGEYARSAMYDLLVRRVKESVDLLREGGIFWGNLSYMKRATFYCPIMPASVEERIRDMYRDTNSENYIKGDGTIFIQKE